MRCYFTPALALLALMSVTPGLGQGRYVIDNRTEGYEAAFLRDTYQRAWSLSALAAAVHSHSSPGAVATFGNRVYDHARNLIEDVERYGWARGVELRQTDKYRDVRGTKRLNNANGDRWNVVYVSEVSRLLRDIESRLRMHANRLRDSRYRSLASFYAVAFRRDLAAARNWPND